MGASNAKTEAIKVKKPELSCWDSMKAKWSKTKDGVKTAEKVYK